jgi:diacylglycerol kinase (ATP)
MIGASTSGARASGAKKAESPPPEQRVQGRDRLRRLVNACGYSLAGLRHAMKREAAIRQRADRLRGADPARVLLPVPAVERLLIILSMLLVVPDRVPQLGDRGGDRPDLARPAIRSRARRRTSAAPRSRSRS